jgi:hypothetical protein
MALLFWHFHITSVQSKALLVHTAAWPLESAALIKSVLGPALRTIGSKRFELLQLRTPEID